MEVTAVILAGGKGTRFVPFVTNKTMWPIGGESLLEHTIHMVQSAGIHNIIVVANEQNESFLKGYQSVSPNLQYRLQNDALGMDDALGSIADLISKKPILVLNAVDMIEINCIKRILDHIVTHKPHLMVCGMRTESYVPAMGYYSFESQKVHGVVEKPTRGKEPSRIIRMVADYFQDPDQLISLFSQFTNPDAQDMRYELAQDVLLKQYGADIEYTSYWSKLKYPHYVLNVMDTFFAHRLKPYIHPSASVAPTAVLDGKVYVDAHARIDAYAVVKGPAYIGKYVTIGNHSLVRHSMVENNSIIGFASEVARSYVGPECLLHHAFVGDSVLEKNINMSWGTVTTNLRLDGKQVRCKLPDNTYVETNRNKLGALISEGVFLGSNVSTMPGVCVAPHTKVLPNSTLR